MRSHKVKQVWSKVTNASRISPYSRMEVDTKVVDRENENEVLKRRAKGESKKVLKENAKDGKQEKTKKKGWKRFRHVALLTCRYIGLGVTHMSPVSTYPAHDYYVDYNSWQHHYNAKGANKQVPHWTTGIILNGW